MIYILAYASPLCRFHILHVLPFLLLRNRRRKRQQFCLGRFYTLYTRRRGAYS